MSAIPWARGPGNAFLTMDLRLVRSRNRFVAFRRPPRNFAGSRSF